jgi:hypothetical protein
MARAALEALLCAGLALAGATAFAQVVAQLTPLLALLKTALAILGWTPLFAFTEASLA